MSQRIRNLRNNTVRGEQRRMKKSRESLYNQQDFFSEYKYNNLNSQKRRKRNKNKQTKN